MQSDRMHTSHDGLADLPQAAEILCVSVATLRNWTAQGLIPIKSVLGRTKYYDIEALRMLKEDIAEGRVAKLDKRRNKSARRETYIPPENVSDTNTLAAITQWVRAVSSSDQLVFMMYEAALQLLVSRGHLQKAKGIVETSLLQLVSKQLFDLGPYEPLFRDCPLDQLMKRSPKDDSLFEVMRQHPLHYSPDEDPLGLLYMGMSQFNNRRGVGLFYTPHSLVDKLSTVALHQVTPSKFPRTLDPACGSGKFLVMVYRKLFSQSVMEGMEPFTAHRHLRSSLVGFDIDPISVWLCKVNLSLEAPTIINPADCHFHIYTQDALKRSDRPIPYQEQFDLVIGNPPWGSKHLLSSQELDFYLTASAHDTYSLFMERSLHALRQRGILAMLVPDSWLYVNKHLATRSLMLHHTSILYLGLTGNAFSSIMAPSILLVAKNSVKDANLQIQVESMPPLQPYTIPQKRFLANPGLLMNLHTQDQSHLILEKMRKTPGVMLLKDQADFALGIVTGNNQAWVNTERCDDCVPIFKGLHIYKFGIKKSDLTISLSALPKFQQVAPLAIFCAKEKLVYRFIHRQLIFAYDDRGIYTLNSANILIPRIPDVSHKYILAVLNSRATQFFYQSSFHSVKVLRTFLEAIPIPVCSPSEQALITSFVDQLMQVDQKSDKRDIYMQIEERIFALFDFTAKEKSIVLKETESCFKWLI